MIKASETLKIYIESQKNKGKLAKKLGVSRQSLYLIERGAEVSKKMMEKILRVTGFGFDEAFEVVK